MIDTHCHLTDGRLLDQLDDVLRRASEAGVSRMITVSTELNDARDSVTLCQGRSNLRCAVGVHPNYSQHVKVTEIDQLREIQGDASVVALGEMGLDYFHGHASHAHQADIFCAQLELARALDKPVVIHCREAVEDTLAIMKDFATVPAVFHCFTGTLAEAGRILDAGYLVGLTGVVTFKKSDELRAVAKIVPYDRLLVETDAPYLAPEPVRKMKVNEPAFVMHTAAAVAWERGISLEQLDHITTQNAERFFRWE